MPRLLQCAVSFPSVRPLHTREGHCTLGKAIAQHTKLKPKFCCKPNFMVPRPPSLQWVGSGDHHLPLPLPPMGWRTVALAYRLCASALRIGFAHRLCASVLHIGKVSPFGIATSKAVPRSRRGTAVVLRRSLLGSCRGLMSPL